MKHLQSFRYIKAIVDAGSIRGGAESLTISPSALNRHIQALEMDLDITLFDRMTRGIQLSAEGELFYAFALNQIASFNRVREQINTIKGLNLGDLTIGFSNDLHRGFFTRNIADLHGDMPNVRVAIRELAQDQLYHALKDGSVDLAVFVNPTMRKGITILHARNIRLSAYVPVGTGLAAKGTLRLYELQNLAVACPSRGTAVHTRIEAAAEKFDVDLRQTYLGPDVEEYLMTCKTSVVGITAHGGSLDRPRQLTGYRHVLLSEKDIGTCNICVLASEDRGLTMAAHRFQEALSAHFQ